MLGAKQGETNPFKSISLPLVVAENGRWKLHENVNNWVGGVVAALLKGSSYSLESLGSVDFSRVLELLGKLYTLIELQLRDPQSEITSNLLESLNVLSISEEEIVAFLEEKYQESMENSGRKQIDVTSVLELQLKGILLLLFLMHYDREPLQEELARLFIQFRWVCDLSKIIPLQYNEIYHLQTKITKFFKSGFGRTAHFSAVGQKILSSLIVAGNVGEEECE